MIVAESSGQIVIVRYPRRHEDLSTEPFFDRLKSCGASIKLLDVSKAAHWSEKCYADDIHPNAIGVTVLAGLLLERAF